MRILVLGSGGREHALCYKLAKSEKVDKVYCAPGNPGMSLDANIETLKVNLDDFEEVAHLILTNRVNLVIVGPENLLERGIVDFLREKKIPVVGPSKKAAMLESSKIFAKNIMKKYQIPTAEFYECENAGQAKGFIQQCDWQDGYVIKCDALAAGKGVVVCKTKDEAYKAIDDLMAKNILGLSNTKVVIEECLIGKEVSCFALCDGLEYKELGFACDHKALRDGNLGPNTGGMGTYSGVDWLLPRQKAEIYSEIVAPTLKGMIAENIPFTGILFVGIMMTANGPKVLEYNVRFGDPETQSLMMLIEEDLVDYLYAAASGTLRTWKALESINAGRYAVHVVAAAHGYPGTEGVAVRKGDQITLPLIVDEKVKVFYAGVKSIGGQLMSDGGRVLGVTATGNTLEAARVLAYEYIDQIKMDGKQVRRDIGAS